MIKIHSHIILFKTVYSIKKCLPVKYEFFWLSKEQFKVVLTHIVTNEEEFEFMSEDEDHSIFQTIIVKGNVSHLNVDFLI